VKKRAKRLFVVIGVLLLGLFLINGCGGDPDLTEVRAILETAKSDGWSAIRVEDALRGQGFVVRPSEAGSRRRVYWRDERTSFSLREGPLDRQTIIDISLGETGSVSSYEVFIKKVGP
jgi:hypothetical protein